MGTHLVKTLVDGVTLPQPVGRVEHAQTVVTLTDEQYAQIPAGAFTTEQFPVNTNYPSGNVYASVPFTFVTKGPYLQDLGESAAGSPVVTVQAAFVAQVGALASAQDAALTSSQNATAAAVDLTTSEALANALKANYNQLQTDVATLRTAYNAAQTDVATLRNALNSLLTSLQVLGGPEKSS